MLPEADGTRLLELLPYIHFSRSKPFLFLKKVYKEPAIYSHFKKQPFASFFLFVMHFIKIYFFFFFWRGGSWAVKRYLSNDIIKAVGGGLSPICNLKIFLGKTRWHHRPWSWSSLGASPGRKNVDDWSKPLSIDS